MTLSYKFKIRHVSIDDEKMVLEWANNPAVRANALNTENISLEIHKQWFRDKLNRADDSLFYIVEIDDMGPVGQVRFESLNELWELHYSIDAAYRGVGLGASFLSAALDEFKSTIKSGKIIACVKYSNLASRKVLEILKFVPAEVSEVILYTLTF